MRYLYIILLIITLFNDNLFSQWTLKTNGLPDTWMSGLAVDAANSSLCVISFRTIYSDKIFLSVDSGNSWNEISIAGKIAGDISIVDNNNIWITTLSGEIYYTSNSGTDWYQQFADPSKTKYMNYVKMFDSSNGIAMGDGLNAASDPAVFLKTSNGGISWEQTNNTAFGGWSGDTWKRLDFISLDIGYFFETGINPQKLHKTTDGGFTWLSTNYDPPATVVKFYDQNIGLVGSHEGEQTRIKKTIDGGNNWTTIIPPLNRWINDIEFLPSNPNAVWLTNDDGLYYSTDMGETWTEHYLADGELRGRDIVFTDDNHGWLLCDNGRVYYTENNGGIVTGVDDNVSDVPAGFLLLQNYPNPFNPSTVISFQLAVGSNTVLKVYDVLGNEVTTLVDEHKPAGAHQVVFDGTDLSSGIYLYTLQAGDFAATKKFVLMK